jgi:hypothetical protein
MRAWFGAGVACIGATLACQPTGALAEPEPTSDASGGDATIPGAGDASSLHSACDAGEPADAYATSQAFECNESLQTIATRGVTLSFDLVLPPSGVARNGVAVILLSGGTGALGLTGTQIGTGADNFCVRTRQMYALQGFVVAVPDAPSDHPPPQGLDNFRATPEHAADLKNVILWLRDQDGGAALKVWLVATSRGTISAADVVANFPTPPEGPDHIVLTSSVTVIPPDASDQEDIQSVSADAAGVLSQHLPVLMIDDSKDKCGASPPAGAQALAEQIGDPQKDFVLLDGGPTPPVGQDVCGGLAYHGFYEDDAVLVPRITAFILDP